MKINISNTISTRKIGDELFIFDRRLSKIHNLNRVGACIWDLLKLGLDNNEIIDRVTERFEIDRYTAQRDFEEYMQELQNKQLLSVKESPVNDTRK